MVISCGDDKTHEQNPNKCWDCLGSKLLNVCVGVLRQEGSSIQKRSGDPTPSIFPKVLPYKWGAYCRTNGRRTAVQMGGVLQGFPFFEA